MDEQRKLPLQVLLDAFGMMESSMYQRAVEDHWIFLVPVCLETRDLSSAFLRRHILQPLPEKGEYMTIEREARRVRVEEGAVVLLGSEEREETRADILYTETYYDADFNALHIVNVASALGMGGPCSGVAEAVPNTALASQLSSGPTVALEALHSTNEALSRKLLEKRQALVDTLHSTFERGGLSRQLKLVERSVAFFRYQVWTLSTDMAEQWLVDVRGVSRFQVVCGVESVLMHALHDGLMNVLNVLHADHDALLQMARAKRLQFDAGLPASMHACLDEAQAALALIVEATTPLGKLRALQECVGAIARQAREAKGDVHDECPSPERPLSLTADELLPMLIEAILRCKVTNLTAHFAYIQFRQDKGSELSYYLTTIQAALEFIRSSTHEVVDEEEWLQRSPAAEGSALPPPPRSPATPAALSTSGVFSPAPLDCAQLAAAMQEGPDALELKDRWWRLSRYRQCFVASDMVDWIVRECELSREQAALLGQKMVMHGLIQHVTGPSRRFEDAMLFFRWKRSVRRSEPPSTPLRSTRSAVALPPTSASSTSPTQPPSSQDLNLLAWEMAHPVAGVAVADISTMFRSFGRCFLPSEGVAWLKRNQHLSAQAARATLAELQAKGLVANLTPSRPVSESYLQFAALSHPTEGPELCHLVRSARHEDHALLSRKTWPGSALVDWLLSEDHSECKSRAEATILARKMQNAGLLHRVGERGLFQDSSTAFQFS